jgi:hypothetical protein
MANLLWNEMGSVMPPYPSGVAPVPEPFPGTGFFPGGLGLWMEDLCDSVNFPAEQIMVVGQDFNTVAAYNRARQLGGEISTSPTWKKFLPILSTSGYQRVRVSSLTFTWGFGSEEKKPANSPDATTGISQTDACVFSSANWKSCAQSLS